MEQSTSCDANSSSADQEISQILRNLKVYYCVYKNQPPVSVLRQISAVHASLSYFLKIHFNNIHLYQGPLSGVFPLVFLPVTYMYLFFPQYVPVELMARKVYCLTLQAFNGFLE